MANERLRRGQYGRQRGDRSRDLQCSDLEAHRSCDAGTQVGVDLLRRQREVADRRLDRVADGVDVRAIRGDQERTVAVRDLIRVGRVERTRQDDVRMGIVGDVVGRSVDPDDLGVDGRATVVLDVAAQERLDLIGAYVRSTIGSPTSSAATSAAASLIVTSSAATADRPSMMCRLGGGDEPATGPVATEKNSDGRPSTSKATANHEMAVTPSTPGSAASRGGRVDQAPSKTERSA